MSALMSPTDEIPGEELKSKKSELRLYCDLLMQQVHSVKSSVQSTQTPDLEVLTLQAWYGYLLSCTSLTRLIFHFCRS